MYSNPQAASLFDDFERGLAVERLGTGSVLLRKCALADELEILQALEQITARAPFRHMVTPGGFVMSVGMTNCGALGWITDRRGYRYESLDPLTNEPWPPMPPVFLKLAIAAAQQSGYPGFMPDACLMNRYKAQAKMSLHQDKNEVDFEQPIVSVSLGLPAVFQFGGFERSDKVERIKLEHGDVVVWGGPDRLRYHGVLPLKEGQHPLTGYFRKAG